MYQSRSAPGNSATLPTTRRLKVLFLVTADDIGGMQRVVIGLARQYGTLGWLAKSVFPHSPKRELLLAWAQRQGVTAEATPALLNAADSHTVRSMLALGRYVRKLRPDVVNLHYGDNFISLKDVIAVRLSGPYRCVITVHHPSPWNADNARKRLMTCIAARLSHAVIVVSQATRDVILAAGVPARKIHLIPPGLQDPGTTPARDEARRRLRLPQDGFVVASLARLVPHKGIADLIEAVSRLPDPQKKVIVAIAGDGPERGSLTALASRLGVHVIFLGAVPDTADLYASADVFVLPSYLEGFGLVYVEAAFHGVPSIGTNVGGVPDAIVDGETGLLVSPGDHDAIAAAIQRLRDDHDLLQRLGRAAQLRARTEFTEARMAERYAKAFLLYSGERAISP